jgi:hypothetical protein
MLKYVRDAWGKYRNLAKKWTNKKIGGEIFEKPQNVMLWENGENKITRENKKWKVFLKV